jgi:hypothetical protein
MMQDTRYRMQDKNETIPIELCFLQTSGIMYQASVLTWRAKNLTWRVLGGHLEGSSRARLNHEKIFKQ